MKSRTWERMSSHNTLHRDRTCKGTPSRTYDEPTTVVKRQVAIHTVGSWLAATLLIKLEKKQYALWDEEEPITTEQD